MLTFIKEVKAIIKKRESFEKHKMMPVKKLISFNKYQKMCIFLKDISKRSQGARIDSIDNLGTILYFPVEKPSGLAFDVRNRGARLGVSQILHVKHREDEQTMYACLEEL